MNIQKKHIVYILFIVTGIIFIIKIFFLQIVSTTYQAAAKKNIIQKSIEYPHRGLILDRHNKILVYNEPIYDLLCIPKMVKKFDTISFCNMFYLKNIDVALQKAKKYSYIKPSIIKKNISHKHFATIQDNLINYSGFFIQARTVRKYTYPILPHSLGYIREINAQELQKKKYQSYRKKELIGACGIEKNYEECLSGKKGIQYQLVNAKGIIQGKFKQGILNIPSIPGKNIQTTVDTPLQLYSTKLMQHKIGSIVAIQPSTGEILTMVSSPSYDPNLLIGSNFSTYFNTLKNDSLAPLFNRPIMAEYPPGSIFKLAQALIALQEKVIHPKETYTCNKKLIKCRPHPSPTNLYQAIKYSCNPYFYHIFKKIINQKKKKNIYKDTQIGFSLWRAYVKKLGLDSPLGIDIPSERGGSIPTIQFYNQLYGKNKWKSSTIRSLDIGQGEMLVTPIQMANFVSIIANRGYYYIPHLVKSIDNMPIFFKKKRSNIDSINFCIISEGMENIAWRARIPGISICCKTGTVENPHGIDHSVFIAFAPKKNPEIAIAVYVENAGWGGRAAAAIGGLVIEQYLKKKITRPHIEDYVFKENFLH